MKAIIGVPLFLKIIRPTGKKLVTVHIFSYRFSVISWLFFVVEKQPKIYQKRRRSDLKKSKTNLNSILFLFMKMYKHIINHSWND